MEQGAIGSLIEILSEIPDARDRRGVRHPLVGMLSLVVLGFICGLVNLKDISLYAKAHWEELRYTLGFTRSYAPNRTTLSRALAEVDSQALENAFEQWVAQIVHSETFTVAVDGKSSRNSKNENGSMLMMVNVFVHDLKLTLAQWKVEAKKGESTVLSAKLKGLFEKYPGLQILTGDAGYSGRALCQAIVDLGKDYVIRLKGNQPKVQEALNLWFDAEQVSRAPDAQTVDKKGGLLRPVSSGFLIQR
jgi:hypothetical protein